MENVIDNDITESKLTEEVSFLWMEHVRVAGAKKSTAAELRLLRGKLAERLFEMKQLLCQPGRAGQWRGWLAEVGIPRSSADRLVERHGEMLGATDRNVPNGTSIPEEEVQKLFQAMLPRLHRTLKNRQMACQFVTSLIEAFGLDTEIREGGILLKQPRSEQKTAAEAEPCLDSDGAAENVDEVPTEPEFKTPHAILGGGMASL